MMRRIVITLAIILIGLSASAQFTYPIGTPTWYKKVRVDSVFWLNTVDTIHNYAVLYPGALMSRTTAGDTSLYLANGQRWVRIGSASAGGGTIDSAWRSNDTLYFRYAAGGSLGVAMNYYSKTESDAKYPLNTRSINTTSPLLGGGNLTADRTLSILNAAADASTKGAATFNASDFNDDGSGLISLDAINSPFVRKADTAAMLLPYLTHPRIYPIVISGGMVGIGKTPASLLDVNGELRLSNNGTLRMYGTYAWNDPNYVSAWQGFDNTGLITYSIGDINITPFDVGNEPLRANNFSFNAFKNQDIAFSTDSFVVGQPYKIRFIIKRNGHLYLRDILSKDSIAANPYMGHYFVPYGGFVYDKDSVGAYRTITADYITPELFGAKGDGVTDDAVALQSTMDAGRPVMIPGKTYLTSTTINVPAGRVITGSSSRSALKTTANTAILNFNGDSIQVRNVKFIGDGKGASLNAGDALQYGIKAQSDRTRNLITQCRFENLGGAGVYFKSNGQFRGNQISDCYFESNNIGVFLDTTAEYTVMTNIIAKDNNVGVYMRGGNNSMNGGTLIANTIGLRMEYGSNNGHSVFSGVALNHNTDRSISADSITVGYTFNGCMIYDGTIDLLDCTGFKFIGCDFSVDSIIATNTTGTLFANNRIRGLDPVLNFDATSKVRWENNLNEMTGNLAPENTSISANTTLTSANKNVIVATPSNITVSLPPVANVPGKEYFVIKGSNNANTVTIDPSGAETIVGQGTYVIYTYLSYLKFYSNGTSWVQTGQGGVGNFNSFITVSVSTALDRGHHTVRTTTSGITFTFPAASTYPGGEYIILNHSAGTVTISPSYTNTAGTTGNTTVAANTVAVFRSDGSAWYQIK
jgi:hypothetical protein